MRIATFNILNGRPLSEPFVDQHRFADAIAALDADVLGLQEVDRHQPRSGGADLTTLAAEAMGAVEHRFVPAIIGTPGETWSVATDHEPADHEPAGRAAYGISLLSRHPVVEWQVLRLPRLRPPAPHLFRDPLRPGRVRPAWVHEEPRVAVAAVLETPLGRMRMVTTHLSFLPWWNGHQLGYLARTLGRHSMPTVLTGDLNLRPRRAARITRMRALASAPTFPADRPRVQIDHLLTDGGFRVTAAGARRLEVSDHQALVVDLSL